MWRAGGGQRTVVVVMRSREARVQYNGGGLEDGLDKMGFSGLSRWYSSNEKPILFRSKKKLIETRDYLIFQG